MAAVRTPAPWRCLLALCALLCGTGARAQPLDLVRAADSPDALGRLVVAHFPQLAVAPGPVPVPEQATHLWRYESHTGAVGWFASVDHRFEALTRGDGYTTYRGELRSATASRQGVVQARTLPQQGVRVLGGLLGLALPGSSRPGELQRVLSVTGDPQQLAAGARFEVVTEHRYRFEGSEQRTQFKTQYAVESVLDGPLPGAWVPGRIAVVDTTMSSSANLVIRERHHVSLDLGLVLRSEDLASGHHAASGEDRRSEGRLAGLRLGGRAFGLDEAGIWARHQQDLDKLRTQVSMPGYVPPFVNPEGLSPQLDPRDQARLVAAWR